MSSILLDSVSSKMLDNRSLWGDTTTPPIEGRWSLKFLPSKPLILLGLRHFLPFLIASYPRKPLILLDLWRKIEKGQADCRPFDPSNYKQSGLAITRFRRVIISYLARFVKPPNADPSEGGLFLCRMQIQKSNEKQTGKEKHEHEPRRKLRVFVRGIPM